jgi:hypothetical protein
VGAFRGRPNGSRTSFIKNLTAREAEYQRVAEGHHVEFHREPAARAADGLIEVLF